MIFLISAFKLDTKLITWILYRQLGNLILVSPVYKLIWILTCPTYSFYLSKLRTYEYNNVFNKFSDIVWQCKYYTPTSLFLNHLQNGWVSIYIYKATDGGISRKLIQDDAAMNSSLQVFGTDLEMSWYFCITPAAREIVDDKNPAILLQSFWRSFTHFWIAGTFTNFKKIKRKVC